MANICFFFAGVPCAPICRFWPVNSSPNTSVSGCSASLPSQLSLASAHLNAPPLFFLVPPTAILVGFPRLGILPALGAGLLFAAWSPSALPGWAAPCLFGRGHMHHLLLVLSIAEPSLPLPASPCFTTAILRAPPRPCRVGAACVWFLSCLSIAEPLILSLLPFLYLGLILSVHT